MLGIGENWGEFGVFTKKKIIAFCCACLVFVVADFWIFSTIKTSFSKTMADNAKTLGKTIATSVPEDKDAVSGWLQNLSNAYPGYYFCYFEGMPDEEGFHVVGGEPNLAAYWEQHQNDETFVEGIESISYLEIFTLPGQTKIGNINGSLLFVPVANAEQDTAVGFLLMAADASAARSFYSLVDALSIIAFALFALGFGIATFSRDPMTGYALLILFAIVLTFVAYPLFEAVRLTLISDGKFSFSTWKVVLTNSQYLLALWGSIKLGICTATISTIIGFVFAFAIARTNIKGKKFINALATMPVISPPFSLTLSIILLFGNNGLITKQIFGITKSNIYGLGGLTLVQTVSMFPIAFMTLQGVLEAIDSTLEDASLDLNASRWQTFKNVTLPLSVPGILSAWLLVFTSSLADFANPLLLAGSYRVLSVESYIEVTGMNRLNNGSALSLLLLLPTLMAFFIQRYLTNKKSYVVVTGKPSMRLSNLASKGTQRFLSIFIGTVIAFVILLYGTIVAGCFVKNWGIDYSFTLANIPEALTRGKDSMISTLILAGIATPIAGLLSMLAAVLIVRKKFPGKRILESLIMAPYAIPGTLMGISYILAFNKPPILLVGTGAILVINYVIREMPVGVEGGIASLRQIDPAIEEAAADLGADQGKIFSGIILPLIRPAFISSMSYTFVRSMTAVSAIIFLISARWYHITIQIYNFSENIRFGLASVLSTALIIIILLVFGLMRLLVRQSEHLEKTMSIQ